MKLNGTTIPDSIVRRVIEFRGSEHSFADLDPARTALVVVDLQHAFMNEAVGFAPVPAARDIVPAVNRLAATVRELSTRRQHDEFSHDHGQRRQCRAHPRASRRVAHRLLFDLW